MKPIRINGAVVSALRLIALGAAIILTASALPALAQQTVNSATLGGRVEDANGAAMAGAVVTATNTETNQSKTSTTDEEGRYRFAYLPVGAYELKVEKSGFASLVKSLTLTVGQALDLPLALS
ncbi:MAG: carboxypeptidase-like regulatory domain-containing protein, partial [Pyrinomonadaceae bacterium]